MSESRVRQFYTGKNLFITGGTGFVGICLVEKILRCVPDVGRIYLLVRRKRGKDIEQRLQDITKNSIFEKLLESASPDIFCKLTAVAGNVGEDNLSLSEQDRQMLIENVHVVIHSAATLDFQEPLRPTVNINLLGTRRVVELCKQCRNLKVMVHVSSAYVSSFTRDCHERLYDAPAEPDDLIELIDKTSDAELLRMQPKILGEHLNTYTFTKHLAEHEVQRCADMFPCVIVRPSMIVAAWQEPIPGWTISKGGPQGFLLFAAKGLLRRMIIARPDIIQDYIPVDIVVNQILAAGYHAAQDQTRLFISRSRLTVYHLTTSTTNPFTSSIMKSSVKKHLNNYPHNGAIWYPYTRFFHSVIMFQLSAIFFHFLPALFFDMALRVIGKRPIFIKVHKNIWTSITHCEKFIRSQWKFHNPRTRELAASLSDSDKKLFFIDASAIDWDDFYFNMILGVRRYLANEEVENVKAARSKHRLLLMLHILLQVALAGCLWRGVAALLSASLLKSAGALLVIFALLALL